MKPERFTKLDYCQYLLSSQVNYTLTNLADHLESWSHDTLNRYLRGEKLTPRLLWEQVNRLVCFHPDAYLIFDDTVLDHRFGPSIEVVRPQWSGNEHRVIEGIGVVSCVYVHPESGEFWVIDYRIYDPDRDGKTKLDHVEAMLGSIQYRAIPFLTVLMDSWYATKDLMVLIERMKKTFYCPIKSNRQVDDSGGQQRYRRVDALEWTETEASHGKLIKIKEFPGAFKVKLFRVAMASHRTEADVRIEWIVTNDLSCDRTSDAQQVSAIRWKVEEFHRETKQLTGIEDCQCRKARIQRNHIACSLLVWTRLKDLAYQTERTLYQLKNGLLHDYLVQQLQSPSIPMVFA
jgi:hypothetical protein